jgi:hypothetical protein
VLGQPHFVRGQLQLALESIAQVSQHKSAWVVFGWVEDGKKSETSNKSQEGEESLSSTRSVNGLDETSSAEGEEEKMTRENKPDQNKSGNDAPKPDRRPAQDHQIIRKDSDGRKIEKTTDWNKPPRPKDK